MEQVAPLPGQSVTARERVRGWVNATGVERSPGAARPGPVRHEPFAGPDTNSSASKEIACIVLGEPIAGKKPIGLAARFNLFSDFSLISQSAVDRLGIRRQPLLAKDACEFPCPSDLTQWVRSVAFVDIRFTCAELGLASVPATVRVVESDIPMLWLGRQFARKHGLSVLVPTAGSPPTAAGPVAGDKRVVHVGEPAVGGGQRKAVTESVSVSKTCAKIEPGEPPAIAAEKLPVTAGPCIQLLRNGGAPGTSEGSTATSHRSQTSILSRTSTASTPKTAESPKKPE